ncbi:MAG: sulfatase [Gemmatimonadales bacterium]|jgi:N-acetylglucosamine-6-sulfatase
MYRVRFSAAGTAAVWTAMTVLTLTAPAASTVAAQTRPQPRNIVLILSDDHRYDFMSFLESAPDFLSTPSMDRMADGGMLVANAFVSTSLCSPSRASILTGQYAYHHGVVDNQSQLREGAILFPQMLQEAGYQTAFVGKWHMGHQSDEPRPGFDHWVSFRGQGVYFDPTLNVDGEHHDVKGYITDILTDYAIDWLDERDPAKPFFLYLSHKAVHAEFKPAPRHRGVYADVTPDYPVTMANTEENYEGKPRWVRAQRYSWHGVDYMYHGQMEFDEFYRSYAETLLAMDESIGHVLDYLERTGLAESTLVIYMSDNGFVLGEHGLIDKRHAYEESMRIPMLAWAPGLIQPDSRIDQLILNVDVAPTLLDLAGVSTPEWMDGSSFLPLLERRPIPWRDRFDYVYYWEYYFPQTPTTFALRTDRYKYIFYHGIWDTDELYDLQNDPLERWNLARESAHRDRAVAMRDELFQRLAEVGALDVPFPLPHGDQVAKRGPGAPKE